MQNYLDRLILGTWQLSRWDKVSHKELQKIYECAIDLGVNKFDTAEAYGNGTSEMVLGRAVKKLRCQVEIYSKFSHHHSSPELIQKALTKTLKRLNSDYLDIYFQHWNNHKIETTTILASLAELKTKGLIRAAGLANCDLANLRANVNSAQIDYVQNCYNPLWRKDQGELLPLCHKANIKYLSYSPFAQGLLFSSVPNSFEPKDPRSKLIFLKPEFQDCIRKTRFYFEEIASMVSTSVAKVLLFWNIKSNLVQACIFSVSSVTQLKEALRESADLENVDWSELDLLYKKIENLVEEYPSIWNWSPK